MDWAQIIFLFLANSGLILWMRGESRSDWRHIDAHIRAIQEEMKDFHGHLRVLDERTKK